MKSKIKGSRRERQVKKILEDQGYICFKSGGSLGLFDIIAVAEKEIRLIQVKSNYISPTLKERIRLLKFPADVKKEVWLFKNRKPPKVISF